MPSWMVIPTPCGSDRSMLSRRGELHGQDAGDLFRPREPDERPREQRLHRGLGAHRAGHPAAQGRPLRLRALVPARDPGHRDAAAAHDPRLRRLSPRPARVPLRRPRGRRSWPPACRPCSRRCRWASIGSGGSTTARGRCSRHVFPGADVPVVQLSMDETQPASFHYDARPAPGPAARRRGAGDRQREPGAQPPRLRLGPPSRGAVRLGAALRAARPRADPRRRPRAAGRVRDARAATPCSPRPPRTITFRCSTSWAPAIPTTWRASPWKGSTGGSVLHA